MTDQTSKPAAFDVVHSCTECIGKAINSWLDIPPHPKAQSIQVSFTITGGLRRCGWCGKWAYMEGRLTGFTLPDTNDEPVMTALEASKLATYDELCRKCGLSKNVHSYDRRAANCWFRPQ